MTHTYTLVGERCGNFGLNSERVASLTVYGQAILHSLILNFAWTHDMALHVSLQIDHETEA